MLISEANLGDNVVIYLNDDNYTSFKKTSNKFPVCIIAETTKNWSVYSKYKLVAWNDDLKIIGCYPINYNLHSFENKKDFLWIEEAKNFKNSIWLKEDFYLCEKAVFNEKQICKSCNRSAPHAKPNLPNNLFICKFCIVMEELC